MDARGRESEPVCIDDEIPFEVPESWAWVRLDSLLTGGPTNGLFPKPVDYETAVKRISLGATTSGIFDGSQFKYVDIRIAKAKRYWLNPGDLLIQRSDAVLQLALHGLAEDGCRKRQHHRPPFR